tara:strand:- start:1974 stop:2591 length:618 start_codon:yes stop_codon:yes gene_type:complete
MRKTLIAFSLISLTACSGGDDRSKKPAANAHDHSSAKAAEPAKKAAAAPAPEKAAEAPKPAAKDTPAAEDSAAPAVEIPEGATVVTVNGNDAMQFDTKEIRVKAGSKVALTLNHTGKLPKTSMGHNLVILAAGTDLSTFIAAAGSAVAEDFVPKSQAASIIVATKLLGGGESDTVVFDAPAAGTYEFLCSFPGHYGIMKGKFIVE